jgi:hypothetical protein
MHRCATYGSSDPMVRRSPREQPRSQRPVSQSFRWSLSPAAPDQPRSDLSRMVV